MVAWIHASTVRRKNAALDKPVPVCLRAGNPPTGSRTPRAVGVESRRVAVMRGRWDVRQQRAAGKGKEPIHIVVVEDGAKVTVGKA